MLTPVVLASLALVTTVSAQAIIPQARQFVKCSCRASNRGFSENALKELKTSLVSLDEERRNLVEASFTDPAIDEAFIDKDLKRQAKEKWEHCVNNYSHEECVNADTSLRIRGSRPATTICYYNNKPDCSKVKEFASTDASIVSGNAQVKFIPPSPPKPNEPKPEPTALPASKSEPKPTPQAESAPEPKKDESKPKQPEAQQGSDTESGKPVNTPTPGTKPASNPVKSGSDDKPVKSSSDDKPMTTDKGPSKGDSKSSDASTSADGSADGSDSSGNGETSANNGITLASTASPRPRVPANEGCVAVEHLVGYHKQHQDDLVRDVLCARGFCATPNHALIVDGVWTSMKQLCSSASGDWNCVESVKLVNNLDIFRNRRIQVSGITITPYDIRFPRFATWVAQFFDRLYSYYFYTSIMTIIVIVLTRWSTS